jgi:NitT/TauT family transport system substrate-binding protein
MLTRRQFGLGTAAAIGAASLIIRDARSAEPIKVKLGSSLGLYELPNAAWMSGLHPKLGFYAEEGLTAEYLSTGNTANSFHAIVTGDSDYGLVSAATFLPFLAQNPDAGILSIYAIIPQPYWYVAVKKDSAYTDLKELKGKKIGIMNVGDVGFFAAKAMFKELGIDPVHDVEFVTVGNGGPAGNALYSGRVDALAIWDVMYAVIDKIGFPLRGLPNTPSNQRVVGATYGVKAATFKQKRDILARYFRAVTKSTIFTYNNREAAVRLFWDMYPEGKPKGKGEDEAIADAVFALDVRKEKWFPNKLDPDQRMGAQSEVDWQNAVKIMELDDKIKDVKPLFTNDIVDECNKFDHNTIAQMAKSFKL